MHPINLMTLTSEILRNLRAGMSEQFERFIAMKAARFVFEHRGLLNLRKKFSPSPAMTLGDLLPGNGWNTFMQSDQIERVPLREHGGPERQCFGLRHLLTGGAESYPLRGGGSILDR